MEEQKVVISQNVIDASRAKKKKQRSARQSEIYRDASNLKHLIIRIMDNAPRKYAKFYDQMLATVDNGKQSLALALEFGDGPARADNLSYAKVMFDCVQDDVTSLYILGVIPKEQKKSMKNLAQKIAGQCVRLRDYFRGQGIDIVGKTTQE